MRAAYASAAALAAASAAAISSADGPRLKSRREKGIEAREQSILLHHHRQLRRRPAALFRLLHACAEFVKIDLTGAVGVDLLD